MNKLIAVVALGAAVAGALGLIGCASDTRESWENPNLPWEAWHGDETECRQAAEDQAEREFALRRFEAPAPTGYNPNRPMINSMDEFDAKRRLNNLFERCMKDRGYRRVVRSDEG